MNDKSRSKPRAVPRGRLSRISQFGRLAGGVAGGMLAEGARRLAEGERPRLDDVLLTPQNFLKIADRLAHLRGAAMKLGQMISMDAGDVLPPELAEILARLREHANHMPPGQLNHLLIAEWGKDWRHRFQTFSPRPMAAASIGQVHKATTHDGEELAIKVQYPGVRESISADVDNVATLLRLSRLIPAELDISSLLEEAKKQLTEEADYLRESEQIGKFAHLLAKDEHFVVPDVHPALTTERVLAMSFVEGDPIEQLIDAPQKIRDRAVSRLFELTLRELFEFRLMQTDPNFANYRYQAEHDRLVLLDFGATRAVGDEVAAAYKSLFRAGLDGDRDTFRSVAIETGFMGARAADVHRAKLDRMIDLIMERFARDQLVDFADRDIVEHVRADAMEMAADRSTWHLPPSDVIFIQRKIGGIALLASRFEAKLDVRGIVSPWLK